MCKLKLYGMIKANELRVGNLIDFEGETCKVLSIDGQGVDVSFIGSGEEVWIDLFQFSPIPLTEEWILKFGFSKCLPDLSKVGLGGNTSLVTYYNKDDSFRVSKISNGYILRHLKGYFIQIKEYDAPHKKNTIKYVHQFQNLYFALTGEELELKLN